MRKKIEGKNESIEKHCNILMPLIFFSFSSTSCLLRFMQMKADNGTWQVSFFLRDRIHIEFATLFHLAGHVQGKFTYIKS